MTDIRIGEEVAKNMVVWVLVFAVSSSSSPGGRYISCVLSFNGRLNGVS